MWANQLYVIVFWECIKWIQSFFIMYICDRLKLCSKRQWIDNEWQPSETYQSLCLSLLMFGFSLSSSIQSCTLPIYVASLLLVATVYCLSARDWEMLNLWWRKPATSCLGLLHVSCTPSLCGQHTPASCAAEHPWWAAILSSGCGKSNNWAERKCGNSRSSAECGAQQAGWGVHMSGPGCKRTWGGTCGM